MYATPWNKMFLALFAFRLFCKIDKLRLQGAELILWHTKDWEGLYPFYKPSL